MHLDPLSQQHLPTALPSGRRRLRPSRNQVLALGAGHLAFAPTRGKGPAPMARSSAQSVPPPVALAGPRARRRPARLRRLAGTGAHGAGWWLAFPALRPARRLRLLLVLPPAAAPGQHLGRRWQR